MNNIKQTLQWLFRITKENFGNKPNNNITIEFKDELKVMTFNIRRDVAKDDKNNWQYRKEAIIEMIADNAPDIICMQEVMPHQAKYIASQLSNYYEAIGLECFTGRDITKSFCILGEGLLTLYRKDRYIFKESERIRLFDGRKINLRRASYIRLWDKLTSHSVCVVNTHLCHKNDNARYKSVKKLLRCYQDADCFFNFICGDFNAHIGNVESGMNLFTDCFTHNPNDEKGTINFFNGPSHRTIDFIFSDSDIKDTKVIRKKYNNVKFLSDHWPIINTY